MAPTPASPYTGLRWDAFGPGGARQAVTNLSNQADRIVDLRTGQVLYLRFWARGRTLRAAASDQCKALSFLRRRMQLMAP